MTRRSRDVHAEPLDVIDGIGQRVHFHLAGVAGAGVHFANGQRPSERQGFVASLRCGGFDGLFGIRVLARHDPGLETLLENTEHGSLQSLLSAFSNQPSASDLWLTAES